MEPSAGNVSFLLVSPFCGGTPRTLQFFVDGKVVGTETLVHHQKSAAYSVRVGQRPVRVMVRRGLFPPDTGFFPLQDTTVRILPDTTVVDAVEFYCS